MKAWFFKLIREKKEEQQQLRKNTDLSMANIISWVRIGIVFYARAELIDKVTEITYIDDWYFPIIQAIYK